MTSERKTAIVVTSTSSIDYFTSNNKIPVYVLNLKVIINGKKYLDGIDMRADAFYQTLVNNPSLVPKTEPPEPDDIQRTLHTIKVKGYTDVIILTLSKNLSTSFQVISDTVKDFEGLNITVYDTETCTIPEGFFGFKAAQMADKGATSEEIIKVLDRMKLDTEIIFCVNDLKYLTKNGRLNMSKSLLAKVLQIKPIISFKAGQLTIVGKVRKIENALDELAAFVSGKVKNPSLQTLGLYMGNQDLYRRFAAKLPAELKFEFPLTPVVGAHIGPDAVGVAFCGKIDKYI